MHNRYHTLDSLRGFAMLLGVVLHAAISFMPHRPAFWSVGDRDPSPLTEVFLFAVHDFRMQLFFLLAGFFCCLLYQKYGLDGMAWHRAKRVAVPFVLGLVFIIPTVMAAFVYIELDNVRTERVPENATPFRATAAELLAANPGAGNATIIWRQVANGSFLAFIFPAHLWFLYYLLYFYAAVLVLAPLLGRLAGTRLLAKLDATFRLLLIGRARIWLLSAGTLPLLLCMKAPLVDTPLGWTPEPQLLAYYFGFFAFGWMLYRHRDLVPAFGRGWKVNLAVANFVVFPVGLALLFGWLQATQNNADNVSALRRAGFVAQAIYTWMMIVGLWGAFLRYFAHASAWSRYMADASYWCYLASMTPIALFQFVVRDWPLPGLLKWFLVTCATMAVLLASYEWCVRYTVIGAILNGRKYRATREVKELAAEPVAVK